jgi:response regulator NasT
LIYPVLGTVGALGAVTQMHSAEQPSPQPRGLIVDDQLLICELMAGALEHFGFDVAGFAHDGRDAIQKARLLLPDFIVMDGLMPEMSGIEATQRILEERAVPIVICTGMMDAHLAEEAKQAGARAFLVKPFATERLHSILNEILSLTPKAAA